MSDRRTKFYLDKRNGKVFGVCSGIADYSGLDVTLVRIGAVLFTVLGGFPWTVIAYLVAAWVANDKPYQFQDETREDAKFWQKVRVKPSTSVRDVRSRFRDIDRRLADVELHVTSHNRRLADEIEALR
ncbi:envelope stress response membrane protein PspC [Sphingomonas sp. ID0503]|uniref:envelope stress response membrane protein PspC n=1 Tax=Sphingomonas sp. ID0503 TaxID=3399691 RepID=UPI003AFB44F7